MIRTETGPLPPDQIVASSPRMRIPEATQNRSETGNPPVGRLAPSPTGLLHLGHARTFLLAWLAAKSQGGRMILRIEDIDTTRIKPGAAEGAIADLHWLGLDCDEGPNIGGPCAPYIQSQRLPLYQALLDQLKKHELVYPCTCTRAEIERAASAPHAADDTLTYPGTCSFRCVSDAEALAGRNFAWRFRAPAEPIAWFDRVLGLVTTDLALAGGDFVVARHNLGPAYQLAVVADDSSMGVTQVVRGADLAPSTPRQIALYRALGFQIPEYAHVPLVCGPDGRRLAKRDGSIALKTLRDNGTDRRLLVGMLAQSCGLAPAIEPSDPADWIDRFDWSLVSQEPLALDAGSVERLGRPPN